MYTRTNWGTTIIASIALAGLVAASAIQQLDRRRPAERDVSSPPRLLDTRVREVGGAGAADRPGLLPPVQTWAAEPGDDRVAPASAAESDDRSDPPAPDRACAGCGSGYQFWSWDTRVRCELCGAGHCAACVAETFHEERFWHAGYRSEWTCRGCGYASTTTRWDVEA